MHRWLSLTCLMAVLAVGVAPPAPTPAKCTSLADLKGQNVDNDGWCAVPDPDDGECYGDSLAASGRRILECGTVVDHRVGVNSKGLTTFEFYISISSGLQSNLNAGPNWWGYTFSDDAAVEGDTVDLVAEGLIEGFSGTFGGTSFTAFTATAELKDGDMFTPDGWWVVTIHVTTASRNTKYYFKVSPTAVCNPDVSCGVPNNVAQSELGDSTTSTPGNVDFGGCVVVGRKTIPAKLVCTDVPSPGPTPAPTPAPTVAQPTTLAPVAPVVPPTTPAPVAPVAPPTTPAPVAPVAPPTTPAPVAPPTTPSPTPSPTPTQPVYQPVYQPPVYPPSYPTPAPTPAPTTASIVGDPHILGYNGAAFYFQGSPEHYYSLIHDTDVSLNIRTAPRYEEAAKRLPYSDVVGFGLSVRHDGSEHRLGVFGAAEACAMGFDKVCDEPAYSVAVVLDGKLLPLNLTTADWMEVAVVNVPHHCKIDHDDYDRRYGMYHGEEEVLAQRSRRLRAGSEDVMSWLSSGNILGKPSEANGYINECLSFLEGKQLYAPRLDGRLTTVLVRTPAMKLRIESWGFDDEDVPLARDVAAVAPANGAVPIMLDLYPQGFKPSKTAHGVLGQTVRPLADGQPPLQGREEDYAVDGPYASNFKFYP